MSGIDIGYVKLTFIKIKLFTLICIHDSRFKFTASSQLQSWVLFLFRHFERNRLRRNIMRKYLILWQKITAIPPGLTEA